MVESKSWDWEKNKDNRWTKPAADAYYLAERWKEKGFASFLDLGCGLGRHAAFFAGRGFAVDAVDLSEYSVNHVRALAARENLAIRVQLSDMQHLPYEDGSFDCLLAYNVLYHADTKGFIAALAEITRVLRPGGELYITLITKNSSSYINADPSAFIDENAIYRDEGETEKHVPHFYADIGSVYTYFSDYLLVSPPVEQRIYGPDRTSTHFLIHGEKKAQSVF